MSHINVKTDLIWKNRCDVILDTKTYVSTDNRTGLKWCDLKKYQ